MRQLMGQKTGRPAGRPKGSKDSVIAARNPALTQAERDLTFIRDESKKQYDDPQSKPEVKAAAWEKYNAAVNRLADIGLKRQELLIKREIHSGDRKKAAAPEYDPAKDSEPECDLRCSWLSCVAGCKRAAWKSRQDAYYDAHSELAPTPTAAPGKVEPTKPAPVVAAPKPVAKIAPMPTITPRPAVPSGPPLSVIDAFLMKHFGDFVRQYCGGVLDADARRSIMTLLNGDPGVKANWNGLLAEMAARAPREVQKTITEAEKAKAFTTPSVLAHDEAFATRRARTLDEIRKTFAPTIVNANPDSGISVELDRQGWLPDTTTK